MAVVLVWAKVVFIRDGENHYRRERPPSRESGESTREPDASTKFGEM